MELTILMPCLNEAETIVTCIQKAREFLKKEKISGEVLIADNGSTDGSQMLATQNGARVTNISSKGYGAALIGGIQKAEGKYIIMGDADDSYDFSNLMPFLEKLRQNADLVMGNRFSGGIKPGAMPFLNKYLGNPVLSFLGRLFFNNAIGDFHCGLRGFNRFSIQSLNLQTQGMEFASEMVVKATIKKMKIEEVPTILSPDGRSRPPHLRKWRDGWRHLKFLLLFSPRWLFLYPGLILSTAGFILMAILAMGDINLGSHTISIHTMLFCGAFFILGLQSITFSLFGKILINQRLQINFHQSRLDQFLEKFSLEKGIFVGTTMVFLGAIGSFNSLWIWANTKFGMLVPTDTMRVIIPAITFLIAGIQIVLSSFFMSFLIMDQNSKHNNV